MTARTFSTTPSFAARLRAAEIPDDRKLRQVSDHAAAICDFWLRLGELPKVIPAEPDAGIGGKVPRSRLRRTIPLYQGDGIPEEFNDLYASARPTDMLGNTRIALGVFFETGAVYVGVFRRLALDELRGQSPVRVGTPFELVDVEMGRDNRAGSGRNVGWWANGRWTWPSRVTNQREGRRIVSDLRVPDSEHLSFKAAMACSIAFYRHHFWEVEVGSGEGDLSAAPSLSIMTNAIGARRFLANREGAYAGDRRAALLHWVRQHRRRRADDPSDEEAAIQVREHLRGKTECMWNGLTCAIRPAQDEMDSRLTPKAP